MHALLINSSKTSDSPDFGPLIILSFRIKDNDLFSCKNKNKKNTSFLKCLRHKLPCSAFIFLN